MFSKRKETPQIDPVQRELYEHARKRIVQKKRLFQHFIVFLVGSTFLVILNLLIGIGKEITFFGIDWCAIAIICWAFLFVLHFCNVWLFHKFMGADWTSSHMERLIAKQKLEIELIQKDVDKMYPKDELIKKKEEFIKHKQPKAISEPKVTDFPQKITMIAAAGENNALGKDNDLVWHLPDDFKRFKQLTTGHHIIMGRKTFESFPKPLPNRVHVVITRNQDYKPEGAVVVHSMEEALAVAKDDPQPFIIGGGEIYKIGMEYSDCIELTRVHGTFEADTFFPDIDTELWTVDKKELHGADERHNFGFTYLTYKKK
ncbi:dihydrofolate reductase [Aquimarina amphilecti]|uniref:dihydrofolate reductase n=1 Tax=Aquimarina amphilecti TaxID=1038014 RepID=A0A1H7MXD6_AQUAM|nr:dihydrofolate reductase [Aquimarina amphilecti]SEL15448.1 dihydrofolate reductase [Aquimarina amphilecti]